MQCIFRNYLILQTLGLVILVAVGCADSASAKFDIPNIPQVEFTPEPTPTATPPPDNHNIQKASSEASNAITASNTPTSTPIPTPMYNQDEESGTPMRPTVVSSPTSVATSKSGPSLTAMLQSLQVPQVSTYWPSYADYRLALVKRVNELEGNPGGFLRAGEPSYPHYAAVYAAWQCFLGEEMTSESFRDYVGRSLFYIRTASQKPVIVEDAENVIALILGLSGEDVGDSCVRGFMFPESPTEAFLAVDLSRAAFDTSGWATSAIMGIDSSLDFLLPSKLGKWFSDPEISQREDFFSWTYPLIGDEPEVEPAQDVVVPDNAVIIDTTLWALERQIAELRSEIASLR